METLLSKDGTPIAYETSGTGPAVILVSGAMGTRSSFSQLAQLLAPHFTAVAYDRRGRVDSGDTQPYAVEREIEDIEALIDRVAQTTGGKAYLYGISSGGALALEAAAHLPNKVKKLAIYEVPFIVDDSHAPLPINYVPHLQQLIAEGKRGDAVAYFMTAAVGIPEEYVASMRSAPMWGGLEAVAHTIWYDGLIMGDRMSGNPLPVDRWVTATMPTLVFTGEASDPFFENSAKELTSILPNAQRRTVPGQSHDIQNEVLAPILIDFFGA